ncbi:MAG: DUF2071 domain-containing protein [Polyangiaceae bacterium]|jgi:hypothetical protein
MRRGDAGRGVEKALLATIACHAVAMVAMAAVLLPMMPGGPTHDDAARMAAVAATPTAWRLGWATWGITAVSDVALGVALVAWPRVPRGRAWVALALVGAAVVPDQLAQLRWVTRGVALARAGDLAAYLAFEHDVFVLTAAWAALLYTAASVAWCACFAAAGAWSRRLTRLSIPLFTLFAAASLAPMLPPSVHLPSWAVGAANAAGFVGLELWLFLLLDRVAHLARPDAPHGRYAPWRAPHRFRGAALLDAAANSRGLHRLLTLFPVPTFRSEIRDVVYVNYLVPAAKLAHLVPEGLELQRLGPDGAWAMLTFLTYVHGHFGPAVAGPFRRFFPSPVQTNWRTYVRDPRTGREGIYFTTNAVTTRLHALGGRLMSEAPMHLLASGEVTRDAVGAMRVVVDPGDGSGPDLALELRPAPAFSLASSWDACFADPRAMLAYCVPQDRAMSTEPWRQCTTRDEIDLGIPLDACEPLEGTVRSRAAEAIVGDIEPVCFRVPSVAFVLRGEERDRWK